MNLHKFIIDESLKLIETTFDTRKWAETIGINLVENQVEIVDIVCHPKSKYINILGSRSMGKTYAIGGVSIKQCLNYPGYKVVVFGPRADQATRIISEISGICKRNKILCELVDWNNTSKQHIAFKNTSDIVALSASELSEIEGWHGDLGILDECFVYDTPITLADGSQRKIGDIVTEKKSINVLSYDIESASLVSRSVTDFKEIPLQKQMLEIELEDGQIIKCTCDHKFYTKRGWIEAQELKETDDIAKLYYCQYCKKPFLSFKNNQKYCSSVCRLHQYDKLKTKNTCRYCNKEYFTKDSPIYNYCSLECHDNDTPHKCILCGKLYRSNFNNTKYCSQECYRKFKDILRPKKPSKLCIVCNKPLHKGTKYCSHNCYVAHKKRTHYCIVCGKPVQKYYQKCCSALCVSKLNSIRMINNNPMHKSETIKKLRASMAKVWADPIKLAERLRNWKNAPKYRRGKTTRPERFIMSLQIPHLNYTGNGQRWITFKTGRHKNPDFSFNNSHVIEVGDFEYWHTPEEALDVVQQYAAVGIKCLYLDAASVVDSNRDIILKQINDFLCA